MSGLNTSLSYRDSASYTDENSGNDSHFGTGDDTLHLRARTKYPHILEGSGEQSEVGAGGPENIETIAYRATRNYFARVLNLPKDPNGKISVDKDTVLRHFDWKNERVADYTVDSIFDDVIGQVAAERSRRGQGSRSNVKVHPDLTASKFTADKGDYASRLDQMVQSIGGPELLEALRKASELITSQMDEDEEDSDSDISSPNMRAPDMPPAPSVPTSARPVIGSAKAAGASQGSSKAGASSGSSKAGASSGASSASSAEAQAAQEKIAKALESGGDDLVSLSENDELMKHASEEQKSEMIAKLQEHSDKKGKCDSRPEGNKADRAIANVMQSANDKSEFDNLMKAHGGQELLHSVEYGEAKQSLVQAAAAWGSNEFIDEKHQEKYSKEIAASQDLFLNPPDKSSKIQPPAVGSYGSDPTATGLERVESETNAYIADQAYTNLSPRAQREMLLMNAQRASEGKEAVDNTEVISEVERLRSRTLAQIEAGDEDSYKEQWEAWKQGLERIRKEHDMSEDAFRHTVTSRYENFYLGTNVSFGEPDSGEKDERSNEEKYHSYTRDEADLEQLREKYGQAPASAINGLDASSSLGATGVAGQAAQEELHKLLQEYEQAVAEEGFESRRAETLRQEIADLEESSSEYTADLNKIGVELDTLYQPPPADTFWLKFTEVFLAVAELAMTLAAAAFLGPAGVALVSAGWAIYHATQKDWMAMAGSLAGGAVGGMGAASGAIAKSAAKGSQTGATLARGVGSKAATSTTKAAATTGAKSASTFSQNVSNLVAKTGKAGQFMGLNPADDVLITTGKLTNISQTTFETSYASAQGDALGAVSSGLGLSQEGMGARRLTRLTQNSATAAVTTAYTVQAGQKFADGNYQGAFDLIGALSNAGNLSGSNEHFKAGIGGVNEGLPTIDYSRSGNLDTATADAPDKESSLSGSEEADAVESAEETKRTEAEEAERIRVAKEVEHRRFTGRSSQVKVEQMLENTLGADVAKNIDAYYDPKMPEGQVRYTPDPDTEGKLQLSYGPKSNEQNIQWHVEHLDTLLDYAEKNVDRGDYIPELSTPEAITQLEFDKHEVLMEKAQAVIDDDSGQYTAADKAMAKENLAIYEQEQTDIMQRISDEEHTQQLDTEGRRQVAAGGAGTGSSRKIDADQSSGGVEVRGAAREAMPADFTSDLNSLIQLKKAEDIKAKRNDILRSLTPEQQEVFYRKVAESIYHDLPGLGDFLKRFVSENGILMKLEEPYGPMLSNAMKGIESKKNWLIEAASQSSSLSTLMTLDLTMKSKNEDHPRFLYRGETKLAESGPEAHNVIFGEGLAANGNNLDLMRHVFDLDSKNSGYISTSKNFNIANQFAGKKESEAIGKEKYRNIFIIKNDGSGIDVAEANVSLGKKGGVKNEYEVSMPLRVHPENVVGVIRVPQTHELEKSTTWIPNPNYIADGGDEVESSIRRTKSAEHLGDKGEVNANTPKRSASLSNLDEVDEVSADTTMEAIASELREAEKARPIPALNRILEKAENDKNRAEQLIPKARLEIAKSRHFTSQMHSSTNGLADVIRDFSVGARISELSGLNIEAEKAKEAAGTANRLTSEANQAIEDLERAIAEGADAHEIAVRAEELSQKSEQAKQAVKNAIKAVETIANKAQGIADGSNHSQVQEATSAVVKTSKNTVAVAKKALGVTTEADQKSQKVAIAANLAEYSAEADFYNSSENMGTLGADDSGKNLRSGGSEIVVKQVNQMLEETLGADIAKDIKADYDSSLRSGEVRYTPDRDAEGKLKLSYGPNNNEQNIQWHVEHLDTLLQYNDNQGVGVLIPALERPEAITQLEFDKHEKLIKKAQAVIDDKTGQYSATDKAIAEANKKSYEEKQADIIKLIESDEKYAPQVDAEGKRYVAGVCLSKDKAPSTPPLPEPPQEPRGEVEEIADASTSVGVVPVAQRPVEGEAIASTSAARHAAKEPILVPPSDPKAMAAADVDGSLIYNRIRNGESNIHITRDALPPDMTEEVFHDMENAFFELMKRFTQIEKGKELLYQLESYNGKHDLEVMFFPGDYVGVIVKELAELSKIHKKPINKISNEKQDDYFQKNHKVQEALDNMSIPGKGTSSVLIIDPRLSEFKGVDGVYPMDVTVYHELVHALHDFQGKSKSDQPHQNSNLEEFDTVATGFELPNVSENSYRVATGQPLRETYKKYFFGSKESEQIVKEKVKELYHEDERLDASILQRVDFEYNPFMVTNGVEYTLPTKEADRIRFSYGRSSNWMNIQLHARHLDVIGKYQEQEAQIARGGAMPRMDDDFSAQFQLEYDLYSKLIKHTKEITAGDSPYNDLEKFVAQVNLKMYEARLAKLALMTPHNGNKHQGAYQFSSERVIGRPIDIKDEVMIARERALDTSYEQAEPVSRRPIEMTTADMREYDPAIQLAGKIANATPEEVIGVLVDANFNEIYKSRIIEQLTPEQLNAFLSYLNVENETKMNIASQLSKQQLEEALLPTSNLTWDSKKLIANAISDEQFNFVLNSDKLSNKDKIEILDKVPNGRKFKLFSNSNIEKTTHELVKTSMMK